MPRLTSATARFARWMIRPVVRWVARSVRQDDPWERLPYTVKARAFGRGSIHPFPWYFEGGSAVEVKSLEDICAWLMECQYVADPDLFNESDFWQHPRTFERLRQGDCEDHALWAWRKLVELGFDEARQEYIPHAGVDHAFHQHAYAGYLRALE